MDYVIELFYPEPFIKKDFERISTLLGFAGKSLSQERLIKCCSHPNKAVVLRNTRGKIVAFGLLVVVFKLDTEFGLVTQIISDKTLSRRDVAESLVRTRLMNLSYLSGIGPLEIR